MDWGWLGKLALAVLGPAIGAAMSGGANALFAPSPSGRMANRQARAMEEGDARAALQASTPIPRTPEQTQADTMALEASRQRAATFTKLSQEYDVAQKAGPEAYWDPFEEGRIRSEATARVYGRHGGDAPPAQVQREVDRMMGEYRLGRAGAYDQRLSTLRTQMLPYSTVQQPGAQTFSPGAGRLPAPPGPRPPMFSTGPMNVAFETEPKAKANPWMEGGYPGTSQNPYSPSGPGG